MTNEETADYLVSLRLEHRQVPELPVQYLPGTLAEAYRTQALVVERLCTHWGGRPAGYKVALTNAAAQTMLGVPHPVFGCLIGARVYGDGATLPSADYTTRLIECEVGFLMGRDVPLQETPYDAKTIGPYVAAVLPAIEVVEHHFASIDRVTPTSLVADNALHGAWFHGAAVEQWRDRELAMDTRLLVNGETTLTGSGAKVLGHPLAALAWLANELPVRGYSLKAGEFVTTGVTTDEIYPAAAGDMLTAEFTGLGSVRLQVV